MQNNAAEVQKFIRDITRREANKTTDALGFIPLAGIMENYAKGNVKVLRENGDIVGYIYLSPVAPVRRVFQLAVREDARRIELATKLLAQSLGDTPATLRCAADIPGALFWRAVGFDEVKRERPANKRRREIITFARGNTFPLLSGARILPVEFPVITPEPPTTLQAAPSPLIS